MKTRSYIICDAKNCSATIPNHSWGKTKNDDWFHTKDGMSYCPDHHPEWVAKWRQNRKTD